MKRVTKTIRVAKKIASFVLFILVLINTNSCINYSMSDSKNLKVFLREKPTIADPLEFDLLANHVAFRSVLAGVIAKGKKNGFAGILANRWDISSNKKQITFYIREGLKFENGDSITPEIIKRNWLRVAYIQKKKESNSGLFEFLEGYNQLTQINSNIPGITFTKNSVTLKFVRPMVKILDLISFGLYSIAHPSQFSQETGEWNASSQKVISSYFYKISEFTDSNLIMHLRMDYLPSLRTSNAPERVVFTWNDPNENTSDLILSPSFNQNFSSKGYEYFSGPKSSIAYFRCIGWEHNEHICYSKEARQYLRTNLYVLMKKYGYSAPKNFFPSSINSDTIESTGNEINKKISLQEFTKIKYRPPANSQMPYYKAIISSLESFSSELLLSSEKTDIDVDTIYKEINNRLKPSVDLAHLSTSILISSPDEDIRFMFMSKEGIVLPDPTGNIHKLLQNEKLSIAEIDQQLWEDAIIWPLAHYSSGYWVNKRVDLSMLNLASPPIDFAFVGIK